MGVCGGRVAEVVEDLFFNTYYNHSMSGSNTFRTTLSLFGRWQQGHARNTGLEL